VFPPADTAREELLAGCWKIWNSLRSNSQIFWRNCASTSIHAA